MSWLGDSFSTFTGHLSNITKEMLNEGREEVGDYVTELNVANQQLKNFQEQYSAQKQDMERVRKINTELEERCQAAELQINAISSQYRLLLRSKEEEINQLKYQRLHISEYSSSSPPPLLSPATDSERGFDDADFVDLISSQHEINRLGIEVKKLRADRDNWKQLANGSSRLLPLNQESEGLLFGNAKLQSCIQELEQKLQDTIDEHQHQLTILQDHYTSQLKQQQEHYQKEISTLNENLIFFKQQACQTEDIILNDDDIIETHQLHQQYLYEKKELENAKKEIEQMKIQGKEKERCIRSLNHQLEKLQNEKQQFEESYRVAQNTITDLQQKMKSLQFDYDTFLKKVKSKEITENDVVEIDLQNTNNNFFQLKKELEDAQKRIKELETENEKARTSEMRQDVEAVQERISNDSLNSHIRFLNEKEEIVDEMVQVNEQKIELRKQLVSLQNYNITLASEIKNIVESLGNQENLESSNIIEILDSKTSALNSNNQELWKCILQLDNDSSNHNSKSYEKNEENIDCNSEHNQYSISNEKSFENSMVDSIVDDFDRDSLTSSMSELSTRNRELDIRVRNLQQQIETYEREIEHFELVRSDWQTERHAMEDLLLNLRAQLRIREESLSIATAEKGLITMKKKYPKELKVSLKEYEDCDADNMLETVEKQIEELVQSNIQLENEREVLLAEKNSLVQELSTLQNLNQTLNSKINELENQKFENEGKKELTILAEKEAELFAVISEKEESLIQLDQQHQEVIEEFVMLKDNLTEKNKKLQTDITRLQNILEVKEKENDLLKTEVETIREQLTLLISTTEKKKRTLDESTTNQLANSNNSDEKNTMQSIVNAFHTINSDNIQLEEHITSLEESRKHLEVLVEELKKSNEKLIIENQNLVLEIQELKKENNIPIQNESMNSDITINHFQTKENKILKLQLDDTQLSNECLIDLNQNTNLEVYLQQTHKNFESTKTELMTKNYTIEILKQTLEEKDCEIEILKELLTEGENINSSLEIDSSEKINQNSQTDLTNNELEITQKKLLHCEKELEMIIQSSRGNFKNQSTQVSDKLLDIDDKKYVEYEINKSNLYLNSQNSLQDITKQQNITMKLKEQIDLLTNTSDNSNKEIDIDVINIKKYKILEDKLRQFKLEKEQMLLVLDEKTKECSNLKNEVHRLINVISAEKQALSKLQQDNLELSKRDNPSQEATNEAIQNLIRIIRDKDLEIEALNQKNKTLLAIMQQSSPNGNHTEEVSKEREMLTKELHAYKTDREQIISALNQKHQECMKYHTEVQRINSQLVTETCKLDTLLLNHKSVSQKYEEKQKLLINTQNEVIILKQRVSDLEKEHFEFGKKYQEMLESRTSSVLANITKEELNDKMEELEKLQELIKEKEKWIFEKDHLIHELSQDMQTLTDNLKQKENEVIILQRQTENLLMHLKDTKDELNTAKNEQHSIQQQLNNVQSEAALIRELNDRLNMTMQEKQFEIKAFQEKIATLTYIIQEKKNMDQILAESDAMQQKAQQFHHERDEALLALSQRQQEIEELRNEVQRVREREQQLNNELERLREHLLQVEEGYTKEALNAEEREKTLRNKLIQAEEHARISSTAIHNASLQEQLSMIAKQRDKALNQASEFEDKIQQYAASLNNLQLVLEQFQKEHERDIQSINKHYKTELDNEKQKVQELTKEICQKEEQLAETTEALDAASRLSEKLDSKEEIIISLRQEVHAIAVALQKAQNEIKNLHINTEGKVDRQIMKSLVLGYFSTSTGQKPDVIRLLARVLDFNQEEMLKAGIRVGKESIPDSTRINQRTGGWISSLFRKNSSEKSSEQRKTTNEADKSFSALFVQFLQNESQPRLQVRLPAEEMAIEELARKSSHSRQLHINPFNHHPLSITPPSSPTRGSSNTNLYHPLIRPISSSLPTFAPILITNNENSVKSNTFLQEFLN